MATVTPRPVGKVSSIIGAPFRASVELDDDEQLTGYDIQLVPGVKGPASQLWDKPAWSFTSDQPRFVTIDDRPSFEDVLVSRRRPVVQMAAGEPITAYEWTLRQDGDILEEATDVSDGISPDGLTFEFRPTERLRRSGRKAPAKRRGVFYPPFESHLPGQPRSEDTRIRYRALTHPGHDDHDAYAVDFNWGSGGADRGHWVRAAADGRVVKIVEDNGQVHIRHPNFANGVDYETVYAHMDPVLVKLHDRVTAQQRIGRIGSTYHGEGTISPHLHHQHLKDGEPIKMRLLIRDEVTTIPISKRAPDRVETWSEGVPGWVQPRGLAPARLAVRVKRARDDRWSRRNAIRFIVARKRDAVPGDQDELFLDAAARGDGTDDAIAYRYDGADLDAGKFSVRYRARGDAGSVSDWAYDQSIEVVPDLA